MKILLHLIDYNFYIINTLSLKLSRRMSTLSSINVIARFEYIFYCKIK